MLRALTLCFSVLLASALTPTSAEAQSTILRISRLAARHLEDRGWQLISYLDGDLNHRRNLDHYVDVPANSALAFVGVCDDDCTDLRLVVYSGSIKLGESTTVSDEPLVTITGWGDGRRRVNVNMMGCSANPCGYRVMWFIK